MREILKVILPAIGMGLFVYGVGMIGVVAYDKFFSRKKLKKPLDTKSDTAKTTAPADNPPPMRDIQCGVCGYKFIPYNDNRYVVRGTHNYGRFLYCANNGILKDDEAIVDGLHDAFSCPMCGCQIVVHPHLPIYEERQADTDAPTSEI